MLGNSRVGEIYLGISFPFMGTRNDNFFFGGGMHAFGYNVYLFGGNYHLFGANNLRVPLPIFGRTISAI